MLMLAIAAGVTVGGGNVLDGGVLPTAACAYLTKRHAADCGVMISASHNPPEFNGIKVFDGAGCKFDEKLERRLEKYFIDRLFAPSLSVGRYEYVHEAGEEYLRHLGGACSRGWKDCISFSTAPTARLPPLRPPRSSGWAQK